MTSLDTGLATSKCHQKQRFKKLLGGWEKSKFPKEAAAQAGARRQDALSSLHAHIGSGQGNAGDKTLVLLSSMIRVSTTERRPKKAFQDRGRLAGDHRRALPAPPLP